MLAWLGDDKSETGPVPPGVISFASILCTPSYVLASLGALPSMDGGGGINGGTKVRGL